MSCAELTSWTNMSLLEKRENLASFFHVIKGKRPGLSPPWFSWQIQGGRILRGSARGGDSDEGRSSFCTGDAPKPCRVSARPAGSGGEGGEGRGPGGRLRGPPPLLSCVSSQIACASSAPAPSSVIGGGTHLSLWQVVTNLLAQNNRSFSSANSGARGLRSGCGQVRAPPEGSR